MTAQQTPTLDRQDKVVPEAEKVGALERVVMGIAREKFNTQSQSYRDDTRMAKTYLAEQKIVAADNAAEVANISATENMIEKAIKGEFNRQSNADVTDLSVAVQVLNARKPTPVAPSA